MDQKNEKNLNKKDEDNSRITIAACIIATALAVFTLNLPIKIKLLIMPVGFFSFCLIFSAIFAFLFILAKGYELRYGKKKENFIDKYNCYLYNASIKVYSFIALITLVIWSCNKLNELNKSGNFLGNVGYFAIVVILVYIMDFHEMNQMFIKIYHSIKNRHNRCKSRSY